MPRLEPTQPTSHSSRRASSPRRTPCERFLDVSRALELSGSRREATAFSLDATMPEQIALESEARIHVKRAGEWNNLLQEIQRIPGFHDFLRPRQASNILKDLPQNGPVILINVDKGRCDALALVPGSHLVPTLLPRVIDLRTYPSIFLWTNFLIKTH